MGFLHFLMCKLFELTFFCTATLLIPYSIAFVHISFQHSHDGLFSVIYSQCSLFSSFQSLHRVFLLQQLQISQVFLEYSHYPQGLESSCVLSVSILALGNLRPLIIDIYEGRCLFTAIILQISNSTVDVETVDYTEGGAGFMRRWYNDRNCVTKMWDKMISCKFEES